MTLFYNRFKLVWSLFINCAQMNYIWYLVLWESTRFWTVHTLHWLA